MFVKTSAPGSQKLRPLYLSVHSVIIKSVNSLPVLHMVPIVGSVSLCTLLRSTVCPLYVSNSHYTFCSFCVSMFTAIFYSLSIVCQYLTLYTLSTVCQYLTKYSLSIA